MVWDKSLNYIGIVISDFFKQTEKNSKQDKAVVTRVTLLGPHEMIYSTSIRDTKDISSDYVENSV